MEKREPITFFKTVNPGETVHESRELPDDGTIEDIWLRNYVGHDFDLRYTVEVESRNGRRRNVFEYLGKDFITGEDDKHTFDVREEVEAGETIHIKAENNTDQYVYHANGKISVDYAGGIAGILKSLIPGVL